MKVPRRGPRAFETGLKVRTDKMEVGVGVCLK